MKLSDRRKVKTVKVLRTLKAQFKFHYVQMKLKFDYDAESNKVKFKFHYVQMKPPFLTFQTHFNKA